NGLLEQTLGVSFFRNLRKYSNDAFIMDPSKAFYDGRKLKIDFQNNFHLHKSNILTLGIETEKEEARSEYFVFSQTFPFESILPLSSSRTTGVYLQDQFNFGNLYGTSGIRYDNHQRFGSSFTYRLVPAFLIHCSGTNCKVTYRTDLYIP